MKSKKVSLQLDAQHKLGDIKIMTFDLNRSIKQPRMS